MTVRKVSVLTEVDLGLALDSDDSGKTEILPLVSYLMHETEKCKVVFHHYNTLSPDTEKNCFDLTLRQSALNRVIGGVSVHLKRDDSVFWSRYILAKKGKLSKKLFRTLRSFEDSDFDAISVQYIEEALKVAVQVDWLLLNMPKIAAEIVLNDTVLKAASFGNVPVDIDGRYKATFKLTKWAVPLNPLLSFEIYKNEVSAVVLHGYNLLEDANCFEGHKLLWQVGVYLTSNDRKVRKPQWIQPVMAHESVLENITPRSKLAALDGTKVELGGLVGFGVQLAVDTFKLKRAVFEKAKALLALTTPSG